MKTFCTLLIGLPLAASAQLLTTPDLAGRATEGGELVVTGRSAHERTWSRVTRTALPTGETVTRTNRAFVEVGTGIGFKDASGVFRDSVEAITPAPGGAVADQGQCVVFFPNDLADGAIQIQMPNGKQIAAAPRLLAYADADGRNILLGEIKGCRGRLVPPNTVVYEDVCPEDIKGVTVRFSYHFWGLEADVLFTGQLPPRPEALGLSGERGQCALEMWTEWFAEDPPRVAASAGPSALKWAGDDTIDFGAAMRLGEGKAFASPRAGGPELAVGKEMAVLEGGRRFLIERVSAAEFFDLAALPSKEGASIQAPVDRNRFLATTVKALVRRPVAAKGPAMEMAAVRPVESGLTLDWTLVQSSGTYTFYPATYYIRSLVLLGQTTIYGSATLKFTNNASLHVGTNLVLRTSPYAPAIFTSCRDETVGESIPGGSGGPVRLNATYLYSSQTSACDYRHLRFRYAGTAIHSYAAPSATVWHSQFVDCGTCVQSSYLSGVANIVFNNVLMDRCGADAGTTASLVASGAQVTASEMNTLHGVVNYSGRDYYYTNSIARCVTNWVGSDPRDLGSGYADFVVIDAGQPSPFSQVGAGCFYLASGSAYRDAGKTNLTSALLSDLRQTTTYGPVVLGPGTSTNDLVLSPQVEREVNVPDLGYHYPITDYALSGIYVTNGSITIQPGTAIAVYGTNGPGTFGLGVSGCALSAEGTAANPCRLFQYNAVQESGMTNWTRLANGLVGAWWPNSRITLKFTHFSVPAADSTHVFLYDGLPALVQDCQFSGGFFDSESPAVTLRNNLFEGVGTVLFTGDTNSTTLRNNLFKGGTLDYLVLQTNSVVKDNAFDQTVIYDYSAEYGTYDGGYNAFISTTGRLMPTNANDIVLSGFTYTNGPLGNYYQLSTNLVDRGSQRADLSGLYQYTTQLAQGKEGTSVVDIGAHYPAADANGNPVDSDGDLVSDGDEDTDGDGVVDSGETDWQDANDLGLAVRITKPRNTTFTP